MRVVRPHGLFRVWLREVFVFKVARDEREARSNADHKQAIRNVQDVLWHVIPQPTAANVIAAATTRSAFAYAVSDCL